MIAQRLHAVNVGAIGWCVAALLGSAAVGMLAAAHPIVAFDAGVVALTAVLIVKRPFAALLVLLLLRAGIAASPSSTLLDLLTLTAGGLALIFCARQLPGRRVALPFLAFVALALLSVPALPSWDEGAKQMWLRLPVVGFPYARTPSNELLSLLRLAAALPVFAVAAWTVRTPRQLRTVMIVVLVAAAYPVAVGLKQIASGDTYIRADGFGSVLGPFSHPNGFASFLVIVLLVAVVAFFEYRNLWPRIGIAMLLGGGVTCLLFSYTRAAWIGFAAGLVLLALMRYRRLLGLGLVCVLVASVAAPGTTQRAEERFSDLSSESQGYSRNSWSWRTEQWQRMLPYGLDRPVLGRGFGSYERGTVAVFGTQDLQFSTAPRTPRGSVGFGAHNDYVKTLVETGVVGFALWMLTVTGVIVIAARARRLPEVAPWATAVLAAGVALSIVAVADNIQTAPVDMVYLFALTGALAGVTARTRPGAIAERGAPPARETPRQPSRNKPAPETVAAPGPKPDRGASEPRAPLDLGTVRSRVGNWLRRRRR